MSRSTNGWNSYYDVWTVTANLYRQMLDSEAWKSGDQHYFKSFNVFTTRVCTFERVQYRGLLTLRSDGLAGHYDLRFQYAIGLGRLPQEGWPR